MSKIIGITQRTDKYENYGEIRDSLDEKLISLILTAGFIPLQIPNVLNEKIWEWVGTFSPDGFILSGGKDVGFNNDRDFTENALLDFAVEKEVPVLGICRGMQIMGLKDGSELSAANGHVHTRHPLKVVKANVGKFPLLVNSYHNFSLKFCPPNYEILALSNDGLIEAISHKILPWEGWMWHPERDNKVDEISLGRIKNLFSRI